MAFALEEGVIRSVEVIALDTQLSPPSHHRFRGWRVTLIFGASLSCLVLELNIALLIWSWRTAVSIKDDIVTIYEGDCATMKTASVYSHLGINMLSTLLLSASNAGMQTVSAPTREEVTRAHEKGTWLHIGVLGLRNFWWITTWRRVVWVLLMCSSIPIHLLSATPLGATRSQLTFVVRYNSVLFTTNSSNDYNAIIAASNFLPAGDWNISDIHYNGWQFKDSYQIEYLQKHAGLLERLTILECIDAYRQEYVSAWRNVLVMTTAVNETNTVLRLLSHEAEGTHSSSDLICTESNQSNCAIQSEISTSSLSPSWRMTWTEYYYFESRKQVLEVKSLTVDYCLAEKVASTCQISLSTGLLVAVIACNVIKAVCLLVSCLARSFQPLITTGDAIATFLQQPDEITATWGSISVKDVRNRNHQSTDGSSRYSPVGQDWKAVKHRWFAAASRRRWIVVTCCCSATWIASLGLLLGYTSGLWDPVYVFRDWWSRGLGDRPGSELVTISKNRSLTPNVLLTNFPQLLISALYVLDNGLFTSMLLSAELMDFASERKTLRVSQPTYSAQRTTYWMQLPYRYILPLVATMATLHWLISQSLFLTRTTVFDIKGDEDRTRNLYGCGWSPLGLLFSVIVGGLLILVLFANGFRKYTDHMPLMGSCSLAISAACHRATHESTDIVGMPLMYGVLDMGHVTDTRENARVGFSAKEVDGLVNGVKY